MMAQWLPQATGLTLTQSKQPELSILGGKKALNHRPQCRFQGGVWSDKFSSGVEGFWLGYKKEWADWCIS